MLTDYATASGTELWNTTRLQAYLTNIGSPFDSGPNVCRCETLTAELLGDPAPYTTPTADPAPWYDVDYDHSAEFLGFLPLTLQGIDDNPRARNVTNAVGGGGVFSPVRDLPRTITVTGVLIGSTCCGADYGLHYLTEVLNSCGVGRCDGGCFDMFSCCPEEGMTAVQFKAKYGRSFLRTSLVSGPTVTNRSGAGNCPTSGCSGGELIEVEFVLVAATPWAWTDPAPKLEVNFPETGTGGCTIWCLDSVDGMCGVQPCLFADCTAGSQCGDPLIASVSPPRPTAPESVFCMPLVGDRECYTLDLTDRPRWSEDVPIVTIDAGALDLRNVRVTFYENPDPAIPCDVTVDRMLCAPVNDFHISYLASGSTIVIDGRTGQATMSCRGDCLPASTVYGSVDGAPLTVSPLTCASYCVCIEVDANFPPADNATVTIETSGRGL